MNEARDAIIKAKHEATRSSVKRISKVMDDAKIERKAIFKKMCNDVDDEKK